MIQHIFMFLIVVIVLSGCFRKVPVSYMYEDYKKFGTSELEVQKALLECGYESPLGDSTDDPNKMVLMDRCMAKAGFINQGYLDYSNEKTFCEKHPTIPACFLSLEQIPDRNVTIRLNSEWCTIKFPKAKACQP